jgi:hypothetical protein
MVRKERIKMSADDILTCPNCGETGSGLVMKRWHFDNCQGLRTDPYVRLWEEANGPRPIDENGNKYHVHHLNGDHDDNRLENLTCIPSKEHARIHGLNGDTGIISAIEANQARIDNGTHHFYNSEVSSKGTRRRNELHGNPSSNPEYVKKALETKRRNKTDQKSRVEGGQHNFITNHPMKTRYKCSSTGMINTMTAFKRWYKECVPFLEIYHG